MNSRLPLFKSMGTGSVAFLRSSTLIRESTSLDIEKAGDCNILDGRDPDTLLGTGEDMPKLRDSDPERPPLRSSLRT